MNREIKFRVWDNKNEVFLFNDLLWFRLDGKQILIEWDLGQNGIVNLSTNQYILQQYTGLKDKNGVEVYEGDVIENTSFDNQTGLKQTHKFVCKWSGNGFMWTTTGTNVIIGNIYELPVPEGQCCHEEYRDMNGGCVNCGDPCL